MKELLKKLTDLDGIAGYEDEVREFIASNVANTFADVAYCDDAVRKSFFFAEYSNPGVEAFFKRFFFTSHLFGFSFNSTDFRLELLFFKR